jgi:hypothetical protein
MERCTFVFATSVFFLYAATVAMWVRSFCLVDRVAINRWSPRHGAADLCAPTCSVPVAMVWIYWRRRLQRLDACCVRGRYPIVDEARSRKS